MDSKRILLIGSLSPPITGVSICNDKIIKEVSKKEGYTIDIINTSNSSFNEGIGNFSIKKVFFYFKQYFYLYKIFKTDIVYLTVGQTFWGVLRSYPFILFSKVAGKKSIAHIHGNYLKTQFNLLTGVKKRIFVKALKTLNFGIVLSENLKDNLTPFLQDSNIFVIHNFVDFNILNISQQEVIDKNIEELKILFLSNLMTEKGIFDLLDALKILEKKNIKFKANLAGEIDSSIEKEVFSFIKTMKNINYLGIVKGKQKKKLLLESNTFVLPTYYKMEGQPISILEAMASGNIILSTNHAGISDIFSSKNGFFIEKKSPEDIALKLEKLSKELFKQKQTMIDNSLYVKENFTENNFINSLLGVFNI